MQEVPRPALPFLNTTDNQRNPDNHTKTAGKKPVVSIITTFTFEGQRYTLAMPRNFTKGTLHEDPARARFFPLGGQVTRSEFQSYIAYASQRLNLPLGLPNTGAITTAAAAGIRHVLNWVSTTLPENRDTTRLVGNLAAHLSTPAVTLSYLDAEEMAKGDKELTKILRNMDESKLHTTDFQLDLGELPAEIFHALQIEQTSYKPAAAAQCQILPLNELGQGTHYIDKRTPPGNTPLRMDGRGCALLEITEQQRRAMAAPDREEKDEIEMEEKKDEAGVLSTQEELMQEMLTFKVPGATFRVMLSRKLGGKTYQEDMAIVEESGFPRPGMLVMVCEPTDGPPILFKASSPYFRDEVQGSEAAFIAAFAFLMGFKNDANTCNAPRFMMDYIAQKKLSEPRGGWSKENLLVWTNPNSPHFNLQKTKAYLIYMFARLKEVGSRKGYAEPTEYLPALIHMQLKGTLEVPDLNNKAMLLELCAQPALRPTFLGAEGQLNKAVIRAHLETHATMLVRYSTLELHGHITEGNPFREKERLKKAGRIKTIDGVEYVEYTVPEFIRNRMIETLEKAPATFFALAADYRKKSQKKLVISKKLDAPNYFGHGVMYYQPNPATGGMDAAYGPEQFGLDGSGKEWNLEQKAARRVEQKEKFMNEKRWSFNATAALLEKHRGSPDPIECVFVNHPLLGIQPGETLDAAGVKERVLTFFDENWTLPQNSYPGFGQCVWVEAVVYPALDPKKFHFNLSAEKPTPQRTLVGFETSNANLLPAHKELGVPSLWTTMMGGKIVDGKPTRFIESADKEAAAMAALNAEFKEAGLHRAGIELTCSMDRMQIRFSFADVLIFMSGEHTAETWNAAMRERFAAALVPNQGPAEKKEVADLLLKVVQQEPLSAQELEKYPLLKPLQDFIANGQHNLSLKYALREKLAFALVPEPANRSEMVSLFMKAMNQKPQEGSLARYPMLEPVQKILPSLDLLNREVYLRGKLEKPNSGDRVIVGGSTGVPTPGGDYKVVTDTSHRIKQEEKRTGINGRKPPTIAAHLAVVFTEFKEEKDKQKLQLLAAQNQAQPAEHALAAAPVPAVQEAGEAAAAPVQAPLQAPRGNVGFQYAGVAAAPDAAAQAQREEAPAFVQQ